MSLGTIIEDHPDDRVAIIDGELQLTYGELRERVNAMRRHLVRSGHGPGDHIALATGNETHFVTALLATLGIGAIAAPLNPYGPEAETQRKIQSLRPTAVVAGDLVPWLVGLDSYAGVPVITMADVAERSDVVTTPMVDDDAVAVLLSTSGVSGVPKIAQLTHRNLAYAQHVISAEGRDDLRPDDIVLATLPVAHVLGLNLVVLAALRVGATLVFQRRFDVDESLTLIRDHGVTMLVGAPPMWRRWAAADAPDDTMATVRFARSGAAGLPNEVHDAFLERYGIRIQQGYGLTETSSVVCTGRGIDAPRSSVGRPLPDVELVLVDEDGEPVDQGDVGEIVVRSPGVFPGYLDDLEATEAILSPDGWLWTGDVGVFDDDGHLYLVDRVKDIIIVSGFNVYPAEVEDVLLMHEDVRGAVVVGTAHAETGETVVAHIAGNVDVAELDRFVRSQLAGYKVPTEYRIVDSLPVNQAGKALRRELRA